MGSTCPGIREQDIPKTQKHSQSIRKWNIFIYKSWRGKEGASQNRYFGQPKISTALRKLRRRYAVTKYCLPRSTWGTGRLRGTARTQRKFKRQRGAHRTATKCWQHGCAPRKCWHYMRAHWKAGKCAAMVTWTHITWWKKRVTWECYLEAGNGTEAHRETIIVQQLPKQNERPSKCEYAALI